MKGSELKRLLQKKQCYFKKNSGEHEKWYSPITNRSFYVPRHDSKEVSPGTLHSILKSAGIK